MKIKSVKIQNFKSFTNFTFSPINSQLNLLVWENWVWKSTIFESIRILLDNNLLLKEYFSDEDFNNKENPIFIEVDIIFNLDFKNLIDISDYIYNVDNTNIYVKLGFAINKYINFEKTENKDENDKLEAFNEWFYYSRISVDDIDEWNSEIEYLYNNYKVSSKNLKKNFNIIYIDWSRSYKHFYESNSEFSNLVKDEKNHLETIEVLKLWFDNEILTSPWFKNFFDDLDWNINDEIKKISLVNDYEKKSSLSIETPDNKLPFRILKNLLKINLDWDIPLEKNSIWWQYIYFTVFTLFSLKNKKNNDDCFNIFLMEEPEAHLHPQMQRKLFNYINDRENSIIYVSTHSQTIVRTIKDIKKTNLIQINSPKSLPLITDFSSLNINKLNTFIDINKAELFFARWVIFVEWISEEILLPKLFEKKFWDKLEDYWISIVNINWVDFLDYCKLCKTYNIPFVIITDKDLFKQTTWSGRKIKIITELWSNYNNNIFISNFDTLELDLLKASFWWRYNLIKIFKYRRESWWEDVYNSFRESLKEYLHQDDTIEVDYKEKREKIMYYIETYLSKSIIAYNYVDYLNSTHWVDIPNYINNAFDKIISISLKKQLWL